MRTLLAAKRRSDIATKWRTVVAIGRKPNGTHFVAEQRKLSGDRRQITWIFTVRLAPLRYEKIGSNRKRVPLGVSPWNLESCGCSF